MAKTYKEITDKFGGYSLIRNVAGVWVDSGGTVHKDIHNVMLILTAETPQTMDWIRHYKELLEKRFAQIEIFIKISETKKV